MQKPSVFCPYEFTFDKKINRPFFRRRPKKSLLSAFSATAAARNGKVKLCLLLKDILVRLSMKRLTGCFGRMNAKSHLNRLILMPVCFLICAQNAAEGFVKIAFVPGINGIRIRVKTAFNK